MNNRKIRQDARLKQLPLERQAQVMEYLDGPPGHSYADTLTWLREDGFDTSVGALSEFRSWYRLQQQFTQDASTVESLVEQLKRDMPNLTEEQLDDLGQRTFSLLAIREQDLGGFVRVRSARMKGEIERAKIQLRETAEKRLQEGLKLQQEKFRRETCEMFLKWAEDGRARDIANAPVSNSEKIERLGALMFGDSWQSATAPGGAMEA
jgi:hypothetical protein